MYVETCSHHPVTEISHVLLLAVVKFVAFGKNPEQFYSGRAEHGRQRITEQVRTAPLSEHLDNLPASRGESADRASERFAEGAGMDVDAAVEAELLGHSPSGRSYDSGGMALVHHDQGVVLFGQVAYPVHRGDVAVHAEDAVGADDAEPLGLRFLKAAFEVFHIGVFVTVTHCFAEPYAVYYGGVVKGV